MPKKNYDHLLGRRFGDLVVQSWERVLVKDRDRIYVTCRCDCGKIRRVIIQYLIRTCNPCRHCGCKTKEHTQMFNRYGYSPSKRYVAVTPLAQY